MISDRLVNGYKPSRLVRAQLEAAAAAVTMNTKEVHYGTRAEEVLVCHFT